MPLHFAWCLEPVAEWMVEEHEINITDYNYFESIPVRTDHHKLGVPNGYPASVVRVGVKDFTIRIDLEEGVDFFAKPSEPQVIPVSSFGSGGRIIGSHGKSVGSGGSGDANVEQAKSQPPEQVSSLRICLLHFNTQYDLVCARCSCNFERNSRTSY
jgi:hypothetical protein